MKLSNLMRTESCALNSRVSLYLYICLHFITIPCFYKIKGFDIKSTYLEAFCYYQIVKTFQKVTIRPEFAVA